MKLVSITLNDVRRFSHPVRVEGIAAGLNVLCAPNESGKSSLFDALQALFFIRHGSMAREVKALKPHAGGAPEISAEIDTAEGRFRILKRWLAGARAEVWKDERLMLKGQEAEEWIAALMQGGGDVGPAGLLWVRQGLTALDQGSPRDKEAAEAVRRDLMSSVTGELERVTGGRRMERALARAKADLAQYVTGRGPKKGGPLDLAEVAVAELESERVRLEGVARDLRRALDRRKEVLRLLEDLREPEGAAARNRRLAEATAAWEAATRHAEAVTAAEAAVTTARLQRDAATSELARLRQLRERLVGARSAEAEARSRAQALTRALRDSAARLAEAGTRVEAARSSQSRAEALHLAVLKAEAQRGAAERRKDLAQRIGSATALAHDLGLAQREATQGPDASTLAGLEALAQEVAVHRRLRESGATQLVMRYLDDRSPRVFLGQRELSEGQSAPVLSDATLDLPGIGRLELHPGRTDDADGLAEAEARLVAALARIGAPSIEDARKAAAARAAAEAQVRDIEARLKALAPKGIAAMEAELAALPPVDAAQDTGEAWPDGAAAEAAARQAAADSLAAEQAQEALRIRFDADRDAEARAAVTADAAAAHLLTAETDFAAAGDIDARETRLRAELEGAEAALARAGARVTDLLARAPDLDACEAALIRARSVCEGAVAEILDLTQEAARLDVEIDLRSGSGVEEELQDVSLRLADALRTRSAIAFEVDVLRKLVAALEAARETARERYFEPVMVELKPLLRLLWPDAELTFDGDSLLPTALIRQGSKEEIGTLSGGTQEQIALLVRLAFARLLARRGRHAPVILDDALVYSDDDRIERMFDALHRQAQDLQIIVLSCRQRVFRDLGGQKLTLEPVRQAAVTV